MNCNKEELLAYLEGEIPETSHQEIEKHLTSCTECQAELELLKQTDSLWRKTLKPETLTPDFLNVVKKRLPVKSSSRPPVFKWMPLTAAILLIAVGITYLLSPIYKSSGKVSEYNMADGSQIINLSGSEIIINESDRQVILKQEGRLFLQVTPSNKQFNLITPAGTVHVLGTEFLVRLEKGENSMTTKKWIITVLVVSGVVQLINPLGYITGKTGETIRSEEDSAPKKQVQSIDTEHQKQLAKKASNLEHELMIAKSQIASLRQKLEEKELLQPTQPPKVTTTASSEQPITSSSASKLDVKTKALRLGELMAKIAKSSIESREEELEEPTPDMYRQLSEIMSLISELGLTENDVSYITFDLFSSNPKLATDIMAGMFEGLGKPLSENQIAQIGTCLTKLSEINKRIINENMNPIEKAIAQLRNRDTIESSRKELLAVFTDEQGASFAETTAIGNNLFAEEEMVFSSYLNKGKERNKAVETLQNQWESIIKPSSEEEKNIIKYIIEQYVEDYVTLKKTMESIYSKDIMDWYMEGYLNMNDLTAGTKRDPTYKQAKIALDIEFLQLSNKHLKELSSKIGEKKANKLINSKWIQMIYFPNLE